ncbi:hypothetical protein [Mesobacillus jeotgali]|uniref:hypothetical protein n=1 Tax=Mesobacillus jeotgali TaxID=129985 RepID=UPI001CFE67DB|nr:hypothetical protein [Mesobacillus jeotgali]
MNYKIGLSEAKIVDSLKEQIDIDDSLAKAIAKVIDENNKQLVKDIPVFLDQKLKSDARRRGITF